MKNQKKQNNVKSGKLHHRNPHKGRYDFTSLCNNTPELSAFIRPNLKGDNTIDFSDAAAVIMLNKALLSRYYDIKHWEIPEGYLCPPIPGRADYIHYIADLLAERSQGQFPTGKKIRVLDIGTGASCIYPIIGSRTYGWKFIGTDTDSASVKSARAIIESNSGLNKLIKIIHQKNDRQIFRGIIRESDRFDITVCNPPFHASLAEAEAGNQLKWDKLKKDAPESALNFGGKPSELWYPGGEMGFLKQMIDESSEFADRVGWFTSLISKKDNIQPIKKMLVHSGAAQIKVVKMEQGQKKSRFIAWSFMLPQQQEAWGK